jgi:hypothetical protein
MSPDSMSPTNQTLPVLIVLFCVLQYHNHSGFLRPNHLLRLCDHTLRCHQRCLLCIYRRAASRSVQRDRDCISRSAKYSALLRWWAGGRRARPHAHQARLRLRAGAAGLVSRFGLRDGFGVEGGAVDAEYERPCFPADTTKCRGSRTWPRCNCRTCCRPVGSRRVHLCFWVHAMAPPSK